MPDRVTATPISLIRQTESLLDGQKHILTMINEDRPLAETLDAICRLIDAQQDGILSSVLLLDDTGEHLLHGAAPHLPEAFCQAVHGFSIGVGMGSCGTAAALGEQVIVEDIATHPYWAAFKPIADAHGLAACWSTPIRAYDGRVIATFAIYHRQPKSPGLNERKLIDFTAHLVSMAVNRAREREFLKSQAR
jgi:GAF domain-containing protein